MANLTVDPQPDLSTSSESFPVNPSSHNLSKSILIGILIFVLLSLTAYGAYWYGQSVVTTKTTSSIPLTTEKVSSFSNVPASKPVPAPVDETAGWKINTNTKYNYSFKYPENWFIDPNSGSEVLSDVAFRGWGYPDYIVGFVVDVPYSSRVSIEDPIGTKKELGDKVFETKIADLSVSGHQAAKFQEDVLPGSRTDAHEGITVKVVFGSKYLYVEHWEDLPRKSTAEVNKIFDQILATFRFD